LHLRGTRAKRSFIVSCPQIELTVRLIVPAKKQLDTIESSIVQPFFSAYCMKHGTHFPEHTGWVVASIVGETDTPIDLTQSISKLPHPVDTTDEVQIKLSVSSSACCALTGIPSPTCSSSIDMDAPSLRCPAVMDARSIRHATRDAYDHHFQSMVEVYATQQGHGEIAVNMSMMVGLRAFAAAARKAGLFMSPLQASHHGFTEGVTPSRLLEIGCALGSEAMLFSMLCQKPVEVVVRSGALFAQVFRPAPCPVLLSVPPRTLRPAPFPAPAGPLSCDLCHAIAARAMPLTSFLGARGPG
jgi:hypothetical protein